MPILQGSRSRARLILETDFCPVLEVAVRLNWHTRLYPGDEPRAHRELTPSIEFLALPPENPTVNAANSLLSTLSEIAGTGDFHSTGSVPFFLPSLIVDGVGEIAFPLPKAQAKELIAVAEAAPYGMGEKTVRDDSVRKCWQIDAAHFSIKSGAWKKFLTATVGQVREDLGITGKVSAHPYKLLIYTKGGHFKAHRDTEKLDAMFGTLIIALPSAHEGGRLFVRHDGREIEVDFSKNEHLHDFQHAAFFADCEHEVEPVRSGYRCCLVYNLRLDAGDPASLNLALDAQARTLLAPLTALKNDSCGELKAVLLEHSYTEANLSLKKLKGNDVARSQALFRAAKKSGFIAHLALVTYHQTGENEDAYDYGYDDEPDDDGTMGEIYDEDLSITNWRNSSDRRVDLGTYRIEMDCLLSDEKIDAHEPDEKEAEGYTGNAGCTLDHWYHRAAIVLWPGEDHERVICHYDFRGACAAFAELAKKKPASRPAFQRLGEAVIARFPDATPSFHHYSHANDYSTNPFAITLAALADAGAPELLETLLAKVPTTDFLACDAALWKKLYRAFGVETFAPVFSSLLETDPEDNRRTLFQILDGLLARKDGVEQAKVIAARLARLAPEPPEPSHHYGEPKRDPVPPGDREETRILLAASHLLEKPADRQAALAFILADASLPHTREILGPVLVAKSAKNLLSRENSLAPDALESARSLLAAEVARPLHPYPDWTRPCPSVKQPKPEPHRSYARTNSKSAQAHAELAAFMADPAAETHEFRYAQDVRSSLESFIQQHFLDLDHLTLRKGRPHQLICSKNSKSHQHALTLRKQDETLLALLNGL